MTNPPKLLAFYLRVSRQKQEFTMQRHALSEYCRRHGWRLPVKAMIYAEKISGTKEKRTQLDLLARAARSGLVDTILLYQINRMGRSFLHMVNLIAEFERIGIRVIGINDDFDTADKGAHMEKRRRDMLSDAQFERDRISERTIDGLAAARKEGRKGGRPAHEGKAKKIEQARKLLAKKTFSLREVARRVGLDPGNLSRDLKKGIALKMFSTVRKLTERETQKRLKARSRSQ